MIDSMERQPPLGVTIKLNVMAKNLPYFQFEPAEYITGNIQFCSLASQGLFVNIQCFYWQRECEMNKKDLFRKYEIYKELVNELIEEGIIKFDSEKVVIDFLDIQFKEISLRTGRLSRAGKKGAKISNKRFEVQLPNKKVEQKPDSFFYINTKMYKVKLSVFAKEELEITINEFMPSMKPITTEQVLDLMDKEYSGYQFNGVNHVRNTFKKIAKDLLKGTKNEGKFGPPKTAEKSSLNFSS